MSEPGPPPPLEPDLAPSEPLWRRLHRAAGPVAGGIVLDLVDLATFGPVGLLGGFVVGGGVGWWLGSLYGFARRGRAACAVAAALYTAIPFTEVFPVATLIGAIARWRTDPRDGD